MLFKILNEQVLVEETVDENKKYYAYTNRVVFFMGIPIKREESYSDKLNHIKEHINLNKLSKGTSNKIGFRIKSVKTKSNDKT